MCRSVLGYYGKTSSIDDVKINIYGKIYTIFIRYL